MPRPAAATGRFAFDAVGVIVALMLAALALGARWPHAGLAALAVLSGLGLLAEVVAARWGGQRATTLGRHKLGPAHRFLGREAVLLTGVVVLLPGWRWWQVAVVLLGLTAVHGTRLGIAALVLARQRSLDPVITWRNLPVPLPVELAHTPGRRFDHGPTVLFAEAGLAFGAIIGVAGQSPRMVVIGALVSLAAALAAVGYVGNGVRSAWRVHNRSAGSHDLGAALAELGPEVIVYFSGQAEATHALTQWLEVLERIHRPVLVLLREDLHLSPLAHTALPIVVLPAAGDVGTYAPPSARVALYPANTGKNDDLFLVPGLSHCFIGHGDSDKGASSNPASRKYDEIWVAGPAGRDRYTGLHEGFRDEQFVQVGRPQLAGITRADPNLSQDRRPTVLYAPTWEGFFDNHDYSSLLSMGVAIVDGLLASGARVLFKPHPSTGLRLPRAVDVADTISRTLASAHAGHETLGTRDGDLYTAFNRTDILISDISSVVTDYLAARKPYLVTNPRGLPHDEFRATFPATSAAHLLDPDVATITAAVHESMGADRLRARRQALADYLLGPPVADPLGYFLDKVDACVRRASAVPR